MNKTYVALGEDVFEKIKTKVRGLDWCEASSSVVYGFFFFSPPSFWLL